MAAPKDIWQNDERLALPRASLMACAYNAAVNYGTGRGVRKMGDLIRAINSCERAEGFVRLTRLVEQGIIESFTPCPAECEMRPGGLFHAQGCENDSNHPVYRARMDKVREVLPVAHQWDAGVSLVGTSAF
jgi:hypothetical protein